MSNNLGEERLLTIMKTLERTSESEQMILLEYLIVGACDFDLYYHVLFFRVGIMPLYRRTF